MRSAAILTVAFGVLAAVTVAAQSPMRPGRWEVTMQMQMANMPMQMPEMKTTRCVTAEELKDPQKAVPGASQNPNACKVSDYKVTGSIVTWNIACGPPQEMSGSGEITFSNDTYAGAMKMTTPQGVTTMKTTGKRVGDCTP
jgi:hypothetical protein